MLGAIIQNQYNVHKFLYVATLDMVRVADRVQHGTFTTANKTAVLTSALVEYLKRLYGRTFTQLSIDGCSTETSRVTRGVKRRNLLSPANFNAP